MGVSGEAIPQDKGHHGEGPVSCGCQSKCTGQSDTLSSPSSSSTVALVVFLIHQGLRRVVLQQFSHPVTALPTASGHSLDSRSAGQDAK